MSKLKLEDWYVSVYSEALLKFSHNSNKYKYFFLVIVYW